MAARAPGAAHIHLHLNPAVPLPVQMRGSCPSPNTLMRCLARLLNLVQFAPLRHHHLPHLSGAQQALLSAPSARCLARRLWAGDTVDVNAAVPGAGIGTLL